MLMQDNQRSEITSPEYVHDRRVGMQLMGEATAPLIEDPDAEPPFQQTRFERGRVVAATREATQRRLRLQSEQLKRFHQQICLRVNERVLAERAQQQSRDKRIDAKLARLLQVPSAVEDPSLTTRTTTTTPHALHLSRTPHVDALLNRKRAQLKGSGATLSLVEKALRSDAQAREMLLAVTRVARVRESRSCEAIALDELYADEDNQTNDGNGRDSDHGTNTDVTIPAKQRAELYAAVRRRYMAMERERAKQRTEGPTSNDRNVTSASRTVAAGRDSKKSESYNRPTNSERRGEPHVKIVDASAGCEFKLQRQSARASSTPWRNSPSQQQPAPQSASSSAKSLAKAMTHERFLTALQEQLGTPALCSCGGRKGRSECANNCEFYRQPKRKERAATSVCKQHETAA